MRISSSHFFQQAALDITRQQSELARVQEQLSTGKRILRPSDDPSAAARALDIDYGIETVNQFRDNAGFAEQRLGLEEATLGSVTNVLQRVRDLALQANSGVQTRETRAAFRVEVEQRLEELVDYANARDANGDFLFAGFKADTRPFSLAAMGVNYNGDQGQQFVQIGPTRQVATGDPGSEVFQRIRNGNGQFAADSNPANTGSGVISAGSVVDPASYQAHNFTIQFATDTTFDVIDNTAGAVVLAAQTYVEGGVISFNGIETSITGTPRMGDVFTITPSQNQDIFTTLQNFIDAMNLDPADDAAQAQLNQSLNNVVGDLDQALNHIVDVRASVGARQNSIATADVENESVQFQLTQTLSEVRDLDYAEAISRLEFQLVTLQATQQTFARLEGLSLFNLLR